MSNFKCTQCNCESNLSSSNYKKTYLFVCGECQSIHRFENQNLTFIGKTKKESSVKNIIGTTIIYKKTNYTILGAITRKVIGSSYTWTEYTLISSNGLYLYLASAKDYKAILNYEHSLQVNDIADAKINGIKFRIFTYDFDNAVNANLVSASGIFFYDITKEITSSTFINRRFDYNFLSIETYDGKTECYSGKYVDIVEFADLFKLNSFNFKSQNQSHILKIMALMLLFITILFLGLNINRFKEQNFKFLNEFTQIEQPNLVGNSFSLQGDTRNLKIEGVSYFENLDVTTTLHLVNESTNLKDYSVLLKFFNNNINKANSFEIELCNVPQGSYHLEYVLNGGNIDYKSDSKFTIDYQISWVNSINYLPFVIVLCAMVVLSFYLVYEINYRREGLFRMYSYKEIINEEFKILFRVLTAILALFIIYITYTTLFKDCTIQSKINPIENSSYTGSRSHYVYRTFQSSGSHK